MARPSKYETLSIAEQLHSIQGWCKNGATMEDLAKTLGVSESTLYDWKTKYPEFAEAIRAGAHKANGEILYSAFDQACGYWKEVSEIVKLREEYIDEQTGKKLMRERSEVVIYDKYFEPQPMLTKFMLMNRLPNEYREKQEIKTEGNQTFGIQIEVIDSEEVI